MWHLRLHTKRQFEGIDPADIFITSGAVLTTDPSPKDAFRLDDVADVAVVPNTAEGDKCERCWKVLPEIKISDGAICGRCADALTVTN